MIKHKNISKLSFVHDYLGVIIEKFNIKGISRECILKVWFGEEVLYQNMSKCVY